MSIEEREDTLKMLSKLTPEQMIEKKEAVEEYLSKYSPSGEGIKWLIKLTPEEIRERSEAIFITYRDIFNKFMRTCRPRTKEYSIA